MISLAQVKEIKQAIKEDPEKDPDIIACDVLGDFSSKRYDFWHEFEEYQQVLLDAVLGEQKNVILINQFDEKFAKRAMKEFGKLGFKTRLATRKEVQEWRGSDEEYEHKYSAFFVRW